MEIQKNLANFQAELASACENCDRDPAEISLVAVTKNRSVGEINKLLKNGVTAIGENRLQEALAKFPDLAKCEKHFIGRIQSNKAREIAQNFDVIESVASLKVARILNDSADKPLPIFLQVNLSREPQKDGFLEEDLEDAVKTISVKTIHELSQRGLPLLEIQGLMVMGVFGDLEKTREVFAQAKKLNDRFGFSHLSMGMSGDWQIAVEEGTTHLRIGSLLFE